MRLTDSSVAIHPRSPWEAIDLGVLLARQHRGLLMGSWAIVTLPIFTLLSLMLWDYPTLAIVLFWWLKPVYERLPLLILSKALFGSPPSLKMALAEWLQALRPNLLSSLTWRRLSLSRSFILPVLQLERPSCEELGKRVAVLSRNDIRAARLLTAVGSLLEMALWIGLLVMFYVLIPQQLLTDWDQLTVFELDGNLNWLEHLTNAGYALVLVIWGPIYVSCGFTLYLNRRTTLEAWDIELVLRRLRQKLLGSAYVLIIGVGMTLATVAPPAWSAAQDFSCPLPPQDNEAQASPESARLTHQALTSDAARETIHNVLQNPPFKNPQTVSGWRLEKREVTPSAEGQQASGLTAWLNRLMQLGNFLAQTFKILLWALAVTLLCLVIWRYKAWFKTFVSRTTADKKVVPCQPEQLFGLQITAQSLPADIAGSAEQLWPNQPREALGLLYRGLLSRLVSDYQLPLKSADTEGQVLERIAVLNQPQLQLFSQDLTTQWQNLAYGHRLPPTHLQRELCDGWRQLFDVAALDGNSRP
ncbi:DUF4129 domain-containing protein [Pseudomonas caspiana]